MVKGQVKWFNDTKGFGFINVEGKEKDIFVHQTHIKMEGRRTLTMGQDVELEIEETEKGLAARDVKPLTTTE